MTVNRTDQTMDERLIKQIRLIERELDALKTRQLLGGDNFIVEALPLIEVTATLGPNSYIDLQVPLTPVVPHLFLAEPAISLYVNVDNSAADLYPIGANINTTKRFDTWVFHRFDYSTSSEVTGMKNYIFSIENSSTVNTYTYYLKFRFYTPKTELV